MVPRTSHTLLVVDDDPALARTLRRALGVEGYAVECAGDGAEALQRLGAGRFDAVLLDVSLPRLDGLAVCRRMRERRDRTPVLMLTARDAIGDRVSGLDAGADDYLVKPFALYERVWGHDISATSNSLDVYVGYLRRKTEEAGESRLIHTVRGVGFMLGG